MYLEKVYLLIFVVNYVNFERLQNIMIKTRNKKGEGIISDIIDQ